MNEENQEATIRTHRTLPAGDPGGCLTAIVGDHLMTCNGGYPVVARSSLRRWRGAQGCLRTRIVSAGNGGSVDVSRRVVLGAGCCIPLWICAGHITRTTLTVDGGTLSLTELRAVHFPTAPSLRGSKVGDQYQISTTDSEDPALVPLVSAVFPGTRMVTVQRSATRDALQWSARSVFSVLRTQPYRGCIDDRGSVPWSGVTRSVA